MKLRFTRRAIENIDAIAEFLRVRNPVAARHVRSTIYSSIQNLILFPEAGRLQHVAEVRKIVTNRYSYVIYYTVDRRSNEIVILNVKHSREQREYEDG